MNIGRLQLENPVIAAPLAGISDLPFRRLIKRAGCGLVFSEMISANGLHHGSDKTLRMLRSAEDEKPLAVQIFGADPEIMAAAAAMAESEGADILDINFGCSVKKVVKTGAGVALMKTPDTALRILAAVREAVRIPLTIKIRTGWQPGGKEALQLASMAEEAGVDAITVHPRTAAQGFRGKADWNLIARVKGRISIPVIGNGDIATADDALAMMNQTGCDGVMIGRAAIGYPWIFSEVLARMAGKTTKPPDIPARVEVLKQYVGACVACYGERHACFILRSRLGWFVKGLPGASQFRNTIKRIDSEVEAMARIDVFYRQLKRREQCT